ncbi:hypothetical protein BDV95DRAFT_76377 [Massariosphaeria phaeospora]|uniref:Uncharacterized protein n=1 Tax=Massariosphaeria phaeospora TaxID=100035 RepID=A0A7C8I3V2_9PLEO|nr:hypothetical protein BDV95DRAFT_76377 [Massariosphaeria phaeospora]
MSLLHPFDYRTGTDFGLPRSRERVLKPGAVAEAFTSRAVSKRSLDTLEQYTELEERQERVLLQKATVAMFFATMEHCQNLSVSDRLAIFANICGLSFKLNTTILKDSTLSYSTCLLVLIKNNLIELDWSTLKDFIITQQTMDLTIAEVFKYLGTAVEFHHTYKGLYEEPIGDVQFPSAALVKCEQQNQSLCYMQRVTCSLSTTAISRLSVSVYKAH